MSDKKISVEITGESKSLERACNSAEKSIQGISASCKKATNSVKQLNDTVAGLAGIQIGEFVGNVASSIANMGLSCIKASAQMRQYEIAFQTMLKSADAGTKILKDLQKFAADTPFDVPGVVESAQQLVAFGFAADEVIPTLRTLGDAAAGLGKSTEGVQQLAYALGQIKTSGTLKTEDINQLTNAGIGAWEMLAQASGKSISEIKDMTAKGMIDSLTAVQVLTDGINKAYGGMMEKTSKEITGLVSNIEETVGNTSVVIGKYMIDAFDIKDLLQGVSDNLGDVSTKLTEAQEAGKSFSEAIRECVPAPVLVALGGLATVLGGAVVAAMVAATASVYGFIAATLPISGPIIAAGAAIGAVCAGIALYWDEIKAATIVTWNAIAGAIKAAVNSFLGVVFKGVEQVAFALGKIGKALKMDTSEVDKLHDVVDAGAIKAFDEAADGLNQLSLNANTYEDALASVRAEQEKLTDTVAKTKPTVPPKTVDLTGGATKGGSMASGVDGLTNSLAKANEETGKLKDSFSQLAEEVAMSNLSDSELIYAKIEAEKNARIKAVDDELAKQKEAVAEAEAVRAAAETSGNANALAQAQALYEERNALYNQSLLQANNMRRAIEQQAYEESISLETAMNAAKAEMNEAFRAADMESFLEYLDSEQMDKLLALEQEQELRQQLLDWRMESEQTMLDFQMQAGEAVKNQLASGIADLITNGGKLSDVFKNIGKSIVNMFVQFMVKKQAAAALEKMLGKKQAADSAANSAKEATAAVPAAVQKSISVLGPVAGPPAYTGAVATMTSIGLGSISASSIMGGVQEKASGGPVFGAGTGTSDSIPAMLSNGEYVINAKAVRRIGLPLLNALNNGYASGGFISGGDSSSSTVVEFNNYGDINNGTDYDSLMGDFEYTLAMGMRG